MYVMKITLSTEVYFQGHCVSSLTGSLSSKRTVSSGRLQCPLCATAYIGGNYQTESGFVSKLPGHDAEQSWENNLMKSEHGGFLV